MSIQVACQCGQQFAAQPHLAGKRLKCPACGAAIDVPAAAASAAARSAGPAPGAQGPTVACQCGKQFQAPPHLLGKTVKCPACQQPLQIPLPAAAGPSARAPLTEEDKAFWDDVLAPPKKKGSEEEQPAKTATEKYMEKQTEAPPPTSRRRSVSGPLRKKVMIPAIFLLLYSLAGLGLSIFGTGSLLLVISGAVRTELATVSESTKEKQDFRFGPTEETKAKAGDPKKAMMFGGLTIKAVLWGVMMIVYLVALGGAIQMLRMRSWRLALCASILLLVPWSVPVLPPFSYLIVLLVPISIWCIVILSMRDVRSVFL